MTVLVTAMILQINDLQGTARVINYAGLSPQRLPEAIRLLSEVLLPLL